MMNEIEEEMRKFIEGCAYRPKESNDNLNKPTEITREDIDKFVNMLRTEEIKPCECYKCGKNYYGGSYGHHIGECDECWFKRFPKEQVEEFCRSFFE